MSFNSSLVRGYATTIVALTGKTTGSITSAAGLVLSPGAAHNIAPNSLSAHISAGVTTSSIVVTTRWEVSNDNSTWLPLYAHNCPAVVQVAATGSGSLVTTAYVQACPGIAFSFPYIRLAVLNTGATGGAGDNVTVKYNWARAFAG